MHTLLVTAALFAQLGAEDARNSEIRHNKTQYTMPAYRTLAEWEARKAHLGKQILSAAGLLPMPERRPLNPQVFGRLERDGYSIEKVYLETWPGFYLGGNLYRPRNKAGKLPAVSIPHGHWAYGRLAHQPVYSPPALAINLARQGYVAFTYDMVGYNDTMQMEHGFGGRVEQLWSFGPLGLQLWDSIRVIDFLQSLEDVDPGKIAVTGASGGGTQTILLTAVDDRVKWSAPVNMISATWQGGSPCEHAPGVRLDTFNVEIAAMMAPRPMLMVSATGDWTSQTPRVEFPAIRAVYELYGKPENVEQVQIDAPHNYSRESREAVYRFCGRRILGIDDAAAFTEKRVRIEKLQDMLVFHARPLPPRARGYAELFHDWREASRRQVSAIQDREAVRELLRYALAAEWPGRVDGIHEGDRLILTRPGKGDRIPARWFPGSGPAAVLIHPQGMEASRSTPEFERLVSARRPVLLIDAFQTGSAAGPRDRSHRYFLTYNRSDDANRVQDILTALAFLRQEQPAGIELVGIGKAGIWCLYAAAAAPGEVKLGVDLAGFQGRDEDYLRDFFVPGLERAGGLEAALSLTYLRK